MSKTKIEWARNEDGSQGESWNPLRCREINGNINRSKSGHFGTGCTMVSEGCLNCYAGTMNYRFFGNGYGYHSRPTEFFLDQKILERPLRAKKPTTFFVCSMTDLFHESVPYELIWRMLIVMRSTPQHTFQVLTKRPESMKLALEKWGDWRLPVPNIWLGTTAENQEQANIRIPKLLEIRAAIHWVSLEPLLGPIELGANGAHGILDWVVVGGESGLRARPMHPDWARSLRDQCVSAGVPFFFKQWGEWGITIRDRQPVSVVEPHKGELALFTTVCSTDRKSIGQKRYHAIPATFNGPMVDYDVLERVSKKAAGRLLDGREWNEMPEVKR